jgi:hypothetical protein
LSNRPSKPALWWEHKAWRDYASRRFNFYARTRDYRVVFSTSVPTAAISQAVKVVLLNPLWKPNLFLRPGVRPRDERVTIINAFAAHEAAHHRFSPDDIPESIFDIWNALEDERIERLQRYDYRNDTFDLAKAFDFIGDGLVSNQEAVTPYQGILRWRFVHDRSDFAFSTTDPELWADVKPLVEAAWSGSQAQGLWVARVLWEMLGQPPPNPERQGFYGSGGAFGHAVKQAAKIAERDRAEGDSNLDPESAELQAMDWRQEVEGAAQALAKNFIVRRSTLPQPHRTRGKLSVPRVIAKKERPFLLKPAPAQPVPSVSLLWDVSGSMAIYEAHEPAQKAALFLNRVCELTRVERQIIGFGAWARHIATADDSYECAYTTISETEANDQSSFLSPALELALELPKKQVVFIVSDGSLEEDDYKACKKLVQGRHDFIMPILIGAEEEAYKDIFKRCFRMENVNDLEQTIAVFLKNIVRL